MNTKSIAVAVAEKVTALGSTKVVDIVVEKMVNAEVAKRAEALAAALKLSEDTLREQKKASKPDQVWVNQDGTKVENFSTKGFEALKKLNEKLAKIEKVVVAATETGNWGDLYNLVKGGGNTEKSDAKPDDSEATA